MTLQKKNRISCIPMTKDCRFSRFHGKNLISMVGDCKRSWDGVPVLLKT